MKRLKNNIIYFAIVIVTIIGMFSLSGCFLLPYYKTPESITIDNKKYISGFYRGLHPVGVEYQEKSSSLFMEGPNYWWRLEDAVFDIYYCVHKDSMFWNPTLYCKKSRFDQIKEYYHDPDNFDYYIGISFDDESEIKLDENIDRSIVEKAVSLMIDVGNFAPSNPLKKYNRTNFNIEDKIYAIPTIFRRSKDGLFSTSKMNFIYYEGVLYVSYGGRAINGTFDAIVLDDDVNAYMVNLLKEHGLVD